MPREIVSVVQRASQTPEPRLKKTENGFLKCLRLRKGIVGVVGREWFFPRHGCLLCLRECASLGIQFAGQFLESSSGRGVGQQSQQVAFGKRTCAHSKFQKRLNLLERIPQLARQAGQFQRALDRIQQILGLIEMGGEGFDRAVCLQHAVAQPAQGMFRAAKVFAEV